MLLYDIALGQPRREEADFLEQCLQRHGTTTGRTILDLGAGTGLFLEEAVGS